MAAAQPRTERPELPASAHAWLDHLRVERRLAPRTLDTYAIDLTSLAAVLPVALDAVAEHHLRSALARLHAGGMTPRSLARLLSVARGFYRWRMLSGARADNPAQGLRAPKAPKRLPKALAVDATAGLLDAAQAAAQAVQTADPQRDEPKQQALRLRDAAMFELLYSSGLRLAELIGLDVIASDTAAGWVDAQAAEVHVTGKGGKRRMVPVGGKALDALRAWLPARVLLADAQCPALFVGARGERIAQGTVRLALKQLAQASQLGQHVHPHMLRHSFASHVLQSSGDLRAVQELMGHASIAATQVYTQLDFQHLARVYDAAHPRAKKPAGK
ncbi:MAG TPA: tyrosine-type recombinase/integrase [Burkholderiaceae bacterium]|nr:tyrosine-type recombinase/integrase [Burkholderiaceae bacterium]